MGTMRTWEVEVHWREACGADPRAVELQGQLADLLDVRDAGIKVSSLFYLRGEDLDQEKGALARHQRTPHLV